MITVGVTLLTNNAIVIVRRLSDPVMGRFGPCRFEKVYLRSFSDFVIFLYGDLRGKIAVIGNKVMKNIPKFAPPYTDRIWNYVVHPLVARLKEKIVFSDCAVSPLTHSRCKCCVIEIRNRQKDVVSQINNLRVTMLEDSSNDRTRLTDYLDQYENLTLAFFETWLMKCSQCKMNNPIIFPCFQRFLFEIKGVWFPIFKSQSTNPKANPFQLSCNSCLMKTLSFQCRLIAQTKSMIRHATTRDDFEEVQNYIDQMGHIFQSSSMIEYCDSCVHPICHSTCRSIIFVPPAFLSLLPHDSLPSFPSSSPPPFDGF